MSGLELGQAMVAGKFAHPSMMDTIPMPLAVIEVHRPSRPAAPQPLGGVHGGFAATVLDSVTGCAVRTLLNVGVGYGTVDLNVRC
jgi:acyl-coenzyme A thioesterase PaaI-like protein